MSLLTLDRSKLIVTCVIISDWNGSHLSVEPRTSTKKDVTTGKNTAMIQITNMGNSSVTRVTFFQFFYFHRATIKHLVDQIQSPFMMTKARFILLTTSVSNYLPRCTPAAGNSCRRRWHALTRLGSMNAPASSLTFASGWAKITLSSNDVTDLCTWLSKNTCVRACMNERTNEWIKAGVRM